MTTNTDAERAPVKQEHLRLMYATAQERGCQLQHNPNRPKRAEGLCPFHQAETLKNASTLEVNTETGRFHCNYCKVAGNAYAFMARLWQVTAKDAALLMDQVNGTGAPERPDYPKGYFTDHQHPGQQPQHTAALTRAHAFYAQQLQQAYDPIKFLVDLGIDPQQAAAAGLGYAPGSGLPEYLAERGIPAAEMEATRLFDAVTDRDIFQGRLTLADLDYADGVQWMTSMAIQTVTPGLGWRKDRPTTSGLPGSRPSNLLGIKSIPPRDATPILTDDFRLYVLLRAEGFAAALLTQRQQNGEQVETQGRRTAQQLIGRQLSGLIIVMHNRQIRSRVHDQVTQALGEGKVFTYNRDTLLATLDQQQRNLDLFRNPEQYPELALIDGKHAPGALERANARRAEAEAAAAAEAAATEEMDEKNDPTAAAKPETPTEPAAEGSPTTAAEAAIDETPVGNDLLQGVLTRQRSKPRLIRP